MTEAHWPDGSADPVVEPPGEPLAGDNTGADASAEQSATEPVRGSGDAAVPGDRSGEPVGRGPSVPAGTPSGPTGQPAVDAALAQLDAVADRPPAEQVAAFEAAHRALTATLSSIDQS